MPEKPADKILEDFLKNEQANLSKPPETSGPVPKDLNHLRTLANDVRIDTVTRDRYKKFLEEYESQYQKLWKEGLPKRGAEEDKDIEVFNDPDDEIMDFMDKKLNDFLKHEADLRKINGGFESAPQG